MGVYLKNLYDNLYEFLPHLYDVSYALQNEGKLTNVVERQNLSRKVHIVGLMIKKYQEIF